MTTAVVVTLALFIYQAQSQLCGPGLFPGPLGFENGIFGPASFGQSLAQPICSGVPPCAQPAPTCGIQAPINSIQLPSCSSQAPLSGIQVPSCGIQVPSCGIQVPSCGIQVPQCGLQSPSNGIQVPSCGVQAPSCGIQVPSCGIQVPSCGIQAPIIKNIPAPFIPNQPCAQCSSFPQNQCGQCSTYGSNLGSVISPSYSSICDYTPQINSVNTVIDNTLANSLANAIQLLIVSNLLENTLTNPYNTLGYSPICETSNTFPNNIIEIVSPDYYPCNGCNQIATCEPVYETIVAPYLEVPCYQEPISYAPCMEVSSFDNCGVNSYNYLDGLNPFSNFGCNNCGVGNSFGNGYGGLDSLFSPVAAEVLFPAEIPAQLTCNFGYMPTSVPCVSVNVEALPFDSCSRNGLYV